ncbi:MAG: alpha/beta hydrolase, partial [Tenacibaculum sp.]|nr:alpha/beta hydrolase [Tenacibaculum sp.]
MRLFLVVFYTFTFFYSGRSQTSLLEIGLTHGNYNVGFTHYLTHDATRTYQKVYDWNSKKIIRPMHISIWYPSEASIQKAEKISVLDYMSILKTEEEWEYLPDEQILNWFYYQNTISNQKHLKEVAFAQKNIKPSTNKFPAIVYAPSFKASSIENFAICEYLASHGYVVISSPSKGADNKLFTGSIEKNTEAQARDIEFL